MSETPEDPQKPTLIDHGKKVMETADRASTVAETASTALGAIKWVAIAIVTLTLAGGAYGVYKVVSAPAKAVGHAAGAMTDTVKAGAGKIKESGSDVIKRLDIPSSNQRALNSVAETAFKSLSTMAATEPAGVKDRIYRRTHFSGHGGRICTLSVDFGAGELPVTLAADNEAYATAKALGSNDNRLMRVIVTAGDNDIALRTEWEAESKKWAMRWKATTLKKPVSDAFAEERLMDILEAAAKECR